MDSSPWVVTLTFDRHLDFCVWILVVDGMRVSPFDKHPDGDHSLRDRGLDVEGWREWVQVVSRYLEARLMYQRDLEDVPSKVSARLAEEEAVLHERVAAADFTGRLKLLPRTLNLLGKTLREQHREIGRLGDVENLESPALWPGVPAVGERLNELWLRYKKEKLARRRRWWKDLRSAEYLLSPEYHALQQDVTWFRGRSSPILVSFVNYPGPVIYPVPPSTVFLGTRNWLFEPSEFQKVVMDAVEVLWDPSARAP